MIPMPAVNSPAKARLTKKSHQRSSEARPKLSLATFTVMIEVK